MQLREYAAASELGRGTARENVHNQIEDLKGVLARYWTVEAFHALHQRLPDAHRITMDIEENEDGTSSVNLRSVYDTFGKRLWDSDMDPGLEDPDTLDDVQTVVQDFLAAADEYQAFDLTTNRTAADGLSEADATDLYTAADSPRAQVMAALNIRTYPAEEGDADFRTVLEVRGITVDIRIRRAEPGATTLYTEIDLDPSDVPTDRRPVCVTTDNWTTDLHTFA